MSIIVSTEIRRRMIFLRKHLLKKTRTTSLKLSLMPIKLWMSSQSMKDHMQLRRRPRLTQKLRKLKKKLDSKLQR